LTASAILATKKPRIFAVFSMETVGVEPERVFDTVLGNPLFIGIFALTISGIFVVKTQNSH